MMLTGTAVVAYGEKLDIKSGTFMPDLGSEEIDAVTVTLLDNGTPQAVAGGLNATQVTGGNGGFVASADPAPYAWYSFDATALSLPVPTSSDLYTLTFIVTDTLGNRYASSLLILLTP